MSLSIDAELRIVLQSILTLTTDDSMDVTDNYQPTIARIDISNGTGANKAQIQAHDQVTLSTLGSLTLDLQAITVAQGSVFGECAFTDVKLLLVLVDTPSTGYKLQVGGAAANQFSLFANGSDIIDVGPSSPLLVGNLVDGITVDATHKDLKFYNPSGGDVTFRYWIIGEGSVS